MINQMAKILLAAALLITISACERKSCQNVACPVGQNCNNGNCYCIDGYEGTNCNTPSYEKYVDNYRNWNVTESCYSSSPNFPSYTAFFSHNSSNPSELEINNMLGGQCTIYAYIRTDGTNQGNIIEINQQNCGAYTVSGQGIYDPNYRRITFNLTYGYSNGGSYQCTHTFY
jgi:hypothetical protein